MASSLETAAAALLRELDDRHASLTLASVSADGAPHATRTFFTWEHDRPTPSLLVTVLAHSAKRANLQREPRVGFAIGADLPDVWLNGHGEAEELAGPEAEAALAQMQAQRPALRAFTERLPTVVVRIHVRDYRITDTRGEEPPRRFQYPPEP